jgi:E1A/CREB-binding protein
MGHFFCKMHLLVNFATECDKCLKIFEQNVIVSGRNPNAFNNSESGASRLVRTAAKALTHWVRSTDLKNLLSGLCGNTMQQS